MGNKLKPCPFCGNKEPYIAGPYFKDKKIEYGYNVNCGKCGASIHYYNTIRIAKNRWNKRIKESKET